MEGYHVATWRAWSYARVLLHLPRFSFETEGTKQLLAIAFCKAQSKPMALRKPLLLVVLEKDEDEGLTVWVREVVYIFAHLFQPGLSSSSKIKMAGSTNARARGIEKVSSMHIWPIPYSVHGRN
ncbi:hypothetical protein AMTRI_Chr03g149750 [Amborella trichopoda]